MVRSIIGKRLLFVGNAYCRGLAEKNEHPGLRPCGRPVIGFQKNFFRNIRSSIFPLTLIFLST